MKNNISTVKNYFTSNSVNNRFFLIHCILVSIRSLILLGVVFYQFIQPLFLNSSTWVFTYLVLFVSFTIDIFYFYKHKEVQQQKALQWLYLVLDAILITVCLSISYFVLSPVLIFVYMVHIFSAGLLGQYKGAFIQGLLVSFLFSWLLILHPSGIQINSSLVLSFILNNIGFIATAGLSGFFGQKMHQIKWSLIEADKVVNHLENLNELIVNNITMGMFILDEAGYIVYSNTKARSMLNLPVSVAAPIGRLFPVLSKHILSHQYKNINHLKETYITGTEQQIIEFFISSMNVNHTGNTNSTKYLILFQDYTQKQKSENTLKEKEKFISIGKMAAGIAHEIRNPLSSIGGSIQLLDLQAQASDENKKLMGIALREIHRLNNIIGEFLDYAQGTNEHLHQDVSAMPLVQVNPILEELLESVYVNPQWKNISYDVMLKSQGVILGRSDKFKQVFLNIVKNACESMEDQKIKKLSIKTFDKEGFVVIQIQDSGIGINTNDSKHIYDPFFSTKEKGTGLGLAIVRKLVTSYKGEITYTKSEYSRGTICTICFPIQPNLYPKEQVHFKSA